MRVLCTGPESAGTRMLTRLADSLDGVEAIHRSIPHGMEWWNPPKGLDAVVTVVRDYETNLVSAIEAGHYQFWAGKYRNVPARILRAWEILGTEVPRLGIPWLPLTYEGLILHPQLGYNGIADFLDVERKTLPFEIYDPRSNI